MTLPIYKATITDINDGIINVSLVDDPAVGVDFIALSKENDLQVFKSVNEEKHLLTGVIMTANKLIYRRNGDYEYYIKYEPETIRIMAEKMLADMTHENIDIDHKQEILEKGKVVLQELWIKTPDKPGPFENIEDGSLLATYHVYDEEIWEMCKSDRFNGFSLCGYFGVEQEKYNKFDTCDKYNKQENKSMLDKIKSTLKELLIEVEAEAVVQVEASEETPGTETIENEVPETEVPETEVPETETETETQEETQEFTEETPGEKEEETETEEPEVKKDDEPENNEPEVNEEANKIATLGAKVTELTGIIEGLNAEIDAIKTKIVEIETKPAVPAIEEEYQQTPKTDNKWANLGSLLK